MTPTTSTWYPPTVVSNPPFAMTPSPDRRFVQITRAIDPDTGFHTLDAIDNDGRAWWLIAGNPHAPEQWTELRPLPTHDDRP